MVARARPFLSAMSVNAGPTAVILMTVRWVHQGRYLSRVPVAEIAASARGGGRDFNFRSGARHPTGSCSCVPIARPRPFWYP